MSTLKFSDNFSACLSERIAILGVHYSFRVRSIS